ncbi:metal ABC transporter solute-binding protein, Zn/Mn family [Roseibium sp.]|uniref:metal ABC transporter solute-binding protein, Zn/Mn family n=1 Tax=Roseibium sp. TaxID=1936156 RepID=UPI003B5153B5
MKSRRLILKSATALVALSLAGPTVAFADGHKRVVATFSILGDMVDRIGGDHIELTTLVGPDGDAHVYQPTPQDARAVSEADVLIINGLEFEGWLERLTEAANFDGELVVATRGIDAIPFGEDDHHGHGEHAFEWAGVFELAAGTYKWSFAKVDGDYADPAMKMVILESGDIEASEEMAEELLEAEASDAKSDGDVLVASDKAYTLNFDDSKDMTVFTVEIAKDGKYAFFTEHMPFEFEANEHFFKDVSANDVEPIAQEPDTGHDHAHDHGGHDDHGHDEHAGHDHEKDHAGHDHDHDKDHAGHDHDHEKEHAEHDHDKHDHDDHAKHDDHEDHADHAGHDHHGHDHGEFDPHAWQSVDNALVYVGNITSALAKVDPDHANIYQQNQAKYVAELEALDAEIDGLMEALPESGRTVVTPHDAFGYFAETYNLTFLAPVGLSTESEASAADVAKLITQIRDEGINAVFIESITDSRLLEQIANETGATIGGTLYSDALSGPDGPAGTYVDMMRHNAKTLSQALGS